MTSKILSIFRFVFRPSRRAAERGQNAVLLAAALPAILAMIGLMVDGGRLLIEYKRAQVAIDSAAFAAAQRLDRGQFFRDQIVVLNPQEATATGGLYGTLNSRGSVKVTSIEVYGNVVVARGSAQIDTIFLKMFGAGPVRLEVSSQATPFYGISRAGQ